MKEYVKGFVDYFYKEPEPKEMAEKELKKTRRQLLEHLSHKEFYEQCVVLCEKRIERLENYLSND